MGKSFTACQLTDRPTDHNKTLTTITATQHIFNWDDICKSLF